MLLKNKKLPFEEVFLSVGGELGIRTLAGL